MTAARAAWRTVAVAGYRGWSAAARDLLAADVPPAQVAWLAADEAAQSLLPVDVRAEEDGVDLAGEPAEASALTVLASCHRDRDRFAVLYRAWWRLRHGEPHLLDLASDPDVLRLRALARAVAHDVHRVKAFVRFHAAPDADGPAWVAWHRPDHRCLHLVGRFFHARFASQRWAVLTPQRSLAWDGAELRFGPGVAQPPAVGDDAGHALWRTYYGAIFNPARANARALDRHVPQRFRAALSEAPLMPGLLAGAAARAAAMTVAQPASAAGFVPAGADLAELAAALPACRGCARHSGCGAVPGVGRAQAPLLLVGDQPSAADARVGRPFAGAAGAVLDTALASAGVGHAFVTNAVKHPRLQGDDVGAPAPPAGEDLAACRPWLLAELAAVRPRVVVCLGASAALAVLGRRVSTTRVGNLHATARGLPVIVTIHPAVVVAAPASQAESLRRRLADDLRQAWQLAADAASPTFTTASESSAGDG